VSILDASRARSLIILQAFIFFFFFFFFVGQGGRSATDPPERDGAPSSGTTCSLELSLPSPAGIWFKTPLPVGGANTPTTLCEVSEAGSVGVAYSYSAEEYPLNLWGASCPT